MFTPGTPPLSAASVTTPVIFNVCPNAAKPIANKQNVISNLFFIIVLNINCLRFNSSSRSPANFFLKFCVQKEG
jgi:hypothetical protein